MSHVRSRQPTSSTSRTSRCATACTPSATSIGIDQVIDDRPALDEAGVDAIEVAHGDGLNGSSFNYGFGAHTDWEWIEAVGKTCQERAADDAAAARHRHDRGSAARLRSRRRARSASPRTAPRPTSPSSISSTPRKLGMDVSGFLMMSHMIEPDALAQQAKLMEELWRALRLCHRQRRRAGHGRLSRRGSKPMTEVLQARDRARHPRPPQSVARRRQLDRRRAGRRACASTPRWPAWARARATRRSKCSSPPPTARAGSMAATCSS